MNKPTLIACAIVSVSLSFCTAPAPKTHQAAHADRAGGGRMGGMAGGSDPGCMAELDSMESVSKSLREALASDDKEKMKAALQLADTRMNRMKERMSTCDHGRGMMGGKMGTGEGGGMGGMGGRRDCDTDD